MTSKTVGRFSIDDDGITGPADYLEAQGNKLIDNIINNRDIVFNMCWRKSPDYDTAILVRLQTDFAGWYGAESFFRAHGIK